MRRDDVSVLGNKSNLEWYYIGGITGVLEGFFVCNFAAGFFSSSRLEGRLRYLGRFGYLKL